MHDTSISGDQKPPFREISRPPAAVDLEQRDDGAIILSCPRPLPDFPTSILGCFVDDARDWPERVFLAERQNGADGPWIEMTYGDAKMRIDAVAQWLLDHDYGPQRPVMILSENSLSHAVLMLAAMSISAPLAPVSPAYSLLSKDFAKLDYIVDLVQPGLVFVEDADRFAGALAHLDLTGRDVVAVNNVPAGGIDFADLLATKATSDIDAERAKIGPDTVGKILFTSGSTGMPKGVVNTHRMFTAVQAMLRDIRYTKEDDDPTVVLDWLPWHHTFGGNATFNAILAGGGTLYIDAGRPVPGLFDITIRNLHDVAPTYFSCVPGAYTMLADALEADPALSEKFFSRLQGMSYGGAALPQALYERMQDLAVRTSGERIHVSTGYGATETGALNTSVYWPTERMGLIGLPLPSVSLKLLPLGDKFEVRIKGPQIMPGYFKRPDLDAEAFDEEGWFRSGDAAVWADPEDPLEGLVFAGRVTEDFKLTTGTWVYTGTLRVDVLAALSPLASDGLVAGHDRDFIGFLIWPNMAALQALAPGAEPSELLTNAAVIEAVRQKLAAYNATATGSSSRIARALLMAEPPDIDAGEITDKRYINQRTSLDRRAGLVERLYASDPDAEVIVL